MTMSRPIGWPLLLLVCVAGLTGCSGGDSDRAKTYKTTGVVKLNDRPVEGAIVTFMLEGSTQSAIGSTDAEGNFDLSTFGPSDGATEGQYSVAITKVDVAETANTLPQGVINVDNGDTSNYTPPVVGAPSPTAPKASKSPIPEKYGNSQTSGLRATVTASGPNHFEFNLK